MRILEQHDELISKGFILHTVGLNRIPPFRVLERYPDAKIDGSPGKGSPMATIQTGYSQENTIVFSPFDMICLMGGRTFSLSEFK